MGLFCRFWFKPENIIVINRDPFLIASTTINLKGLHYKTYNNEYTVPRAISLTEGNIVPQYIQKYDWKYTKGVTVESYSPQNTSTRILVTSQYAVRFEGGQFGPLNTIFIAHEHCQPIFGHEVEQTIAYIVPYIINVGLSSKNTFGHIMCDIIPMILLLPKEIIRKAYIVQGKPNSDKYVKLYEITGIRPERVLSVTSTECVFGYEVWTPVPIQCMSKHVGMMHQLCLRIREKFPIGEEKPTRFVCIKRPLGGARYVRNLGDFVNSLNAIFQDYKWEITSSPNELENSIKLYRSIKLLFLIGGSAFANQYFMCPGSVVCEHHSEELFIPSGYLAAACDIKYCFTHDRKIAHQSISEQKMNFTLGVELIKIGLKRLDEP